MRTVRLDCALHVEEAVVAELSRPGDPGRDTERQLAQAYNLAMRVTGNAALAEDAVQEAFVRLLREARPGRFPLSHVLRAVHSCAVDLLRSEGARRRREEDRGVRASSSFKPPTGAAELRELAEVARAALAELPGEMRVAIALCCEQGLTQEEAAGIVGVPRGTVARRLQRGLERLRKKLAARGLVALAPAALGKALGSAGLPPAPASVLAEAGRLAREVLAPAAAPGVSVAAVKGETTMKIIAGLILAGAVAAGVAVISRGGGAPLPAEKSRTGGPPKFEPYAFTTFNQQGAYLDGPRLEAGLDRNVGSCFDGDGNIFFVDQSIQGIRCIRAEDGRVMTITGDDCLNCGGVNAAAGPASALRLNSTFHGYQGGIGLRARGLPLAEGKGELYITEKRSRTTFKVWKDEKHGGRWWQERWQVTDPAKLPRQTGQVVDAGGVVTLGGQLLKDGSEMLTTQAGFAYRLAGGKITCVVSPPDYAEREVTVHGTKTIVKTWSNFGGIRYDELGNSFIIVGKGIMWRYWPATKKLEHFVGTGQGGEGRKPGLDGKVYGSDGPTWGAKFFCGPRGPMTHPTIPELFFPTAADDMTLRRVWKGRVSSLYPDGEWREQPRVMAAMCAFKNCKFSRKDSSALYVLVGSKHSDHRIFRVTGIDFTKPTVGPLQEGK